MDVSHEVEDHIQRVPPGATCKGVLIRGLLDAARTVEPEFDPAPMVTRPKRRYLPFLDYPYVDLLTIIGATASRLHPTKPFEEAARRLGRRVYGEIRETTAGRILMDALSSGLPAVLMNADRSYSVFISVGSFDTTRVDERHVRVGFAEYPGFLESYDVGVFEGALAAFGATGEVRATRHDAMRGHIDVRWTEAPG